MKKAIWIVVVMVGVVVAYAQTGAPVVTPSINKNYYLVGTSPYATTIQSAMTAACAATVKAGIVLIPANASPTDNPAVQNGCVNVTIRDERATSGMVCYVYATSTTYVSGPCVMGGGVAVSSVSNSDGTLSVTPTTGAVVASLNLANTNTWTAPQIFPAESISVVALTGVLPIANGGLGLGAAPISYQILQASNSAQYAPETLNGDGSLVAGGQLIISKSTNIKGGAVGSVPYQSAADSTSFIASPTTSGATYAYGWQPSGTAIAPTAVRLDTLFGQLAASNTWTQPNAFDNDLYIGPIGTATSSNNFNSYNLDWYGTFWNGSSAFTDDWIAKVVLGTGPIPTSVLNFYHVAGTAGSATVNFPTGSTVNSSRICTIATGCGGALPSTTNLIAGDGSGGGADSGIAAGNVPLLNAGNTFTNTNNFDGNVLIGTGTTTDGIMNIATFGGTSFLDAQGANATTLGLLEIRALHSDRSDPVIILSSDSSGNTVVNQNLTVEGTGGTTTPALTLPGFAAGFLQASAAGVVSSIAGINAACAGPTCGVQQLNYASCGTATALTSNITSSQTTGITVNSVTCLSPTGVLVLENNNAGEFIAYTSLSGTTLVGVTRAFWGTTGTAFTASGSTVLQVNQGLSTSATVFPYYAVLQNGTTMYTWGSVWPSVAIQTDGGIHYGSQATFTSGAITPSSFIASGSIGTLYAAQMEANNGIGPACATADFLANTAAGRWDFGASNGGCTVGANGIAPTTFYWRHPGGTNPDATLSPAGVYSAAAYATNTNCASAASPAVCGSAPAGRFVVAAAATTVTVNTTAVTANSEIAITPDESLGTALSVTCNTTLAAIINPVVTARVAATSFTVTIPGTLVTNPACYSYTIMN